MSNVFKPLPTFRCPLTGEIKTAHDLPDPTKTWRWTATRKAMLIRAIEAGVITEGLVYTRYHVSPEELAEWRRKYATGDLSALKQKNMRRAA